MKSLDSKFFPKGGFSSSQWNVTAKIKNVNPTDMIHQNNSKYFERVINQIKSRREHQRLNSGLST